MNTIKQGMTGYELSELLFEKYNIEDEITNEVSTMLLTGIGTTEKKLQNGHSPFCVLLKRY